MDNPEKEQFILQAIQRIKELKERIHHARQKGEDTKEIMALVQDEITNIKLNAEEVFDADDVEMSPEELEVFLQNPSNFSKEDWDLLEQIKTETSECKREIIKTTEGEAVKDLIGNKSQKSTKKRKKRWNGPKYI